MISLEFVEYRNRVLRYHQQKRYRDALEVALVAAQKIPDYDAKTSFWIACLQSRLGSHDDAIRTLHDAVKRNLWWPTATLQDPDLESLRGRPEFKVIEAECEQLRHEQSEQATPDLLVRVPLDYSKERDSPGLIVFHQRYGERPQLSSEPWLSVLSRGMLLAVPWSSQVYASDGRCWDSLELSERDVKWTFSKLSAKHRLSLEKIVLGGFSQGGALSIYSAMRKLVPCRGFVAVAPSDWVVPERPALEREQPSEAFTSFIRSVDCRGLRGVVIIGDKDPFFPKVQLQYALMVEKGLEGRLIVEPGLGHDYPEGFEDKLAAAVDFVLTK